MTDSLAAGLALAQVVEQAWQSVAARSVAADREAIGPLRQWLACQPNTHAAVLTGVSLAGAANDQSAREIEALLLGRVARKELTQTTASQHLSLMYRVGKRLRRAGVAVTPTWISAILRPPPSPFPRDTSAALAKVEAWRHALQRALSSAIPEDREHLWPLTALSAVLNGALIDRAKLIRLRQMLDRRELELHGSDGDEHAFIEFFMPFDGLGNHHLQRWWPDPVTELLLARHPRGELPAFKATLPLLQQLLLEQGVPGNLLPQKISEVLRSARIWWAARSAPVDLHSMTRTFASHNLTSRCWRRLVGRPATREPGAIANPGRGIVAPPANAESESELLGAAAADHEWLHEIGEALKVGKPPDASAWAAKYLRGIGADDYRKPYVGWLAVALAVPARNPEIPPSLKTLAEPFLLAAPRLLNYLGERDVRGLDIAELDETYRIILDACESHDPIERIARSLRLFYEHLVREYKVPALPNPRATFGEGGSLMPVDATVISVDEYLAALEWLNAQLELGADPTDTAISRLVLVLTFRCGLRRGEVFGLRLCDVHDQAGIYLHVRRYPNHSLKTPNATRTIRIDVLMPSRERGWLRHWCNRQATGSTSKIEPERQQWRLLSKPGSPQDPASIEGSVRRAMHAVHAVTKEPRLVLHHLRHSCASWLWLKLRAPDCPELVRLLPSMPGLCRELGYARRLRVQLCGAVSGPSRMYSYVIARVLGHASPSTSLEQYLHVGDLFLAAATLREARTTPVGVWAGLTGAGRSTLYEWLAAGPHGVVSGYRARKACSHQADSSPTAPALTVDIKPWRRRISSPSIQFGGQGMLATISRALQLYNRIESDIPNSARLALVANRCAATESEVETWIRSAREFASAFCMSAATHSDSSADWSPTPAPEVDLHQSTVAALNDLTDRFDKVVVRNAPLLRQTMALVPDRFNHRRNDVVFPGPQDEVAARQFLKVMDIADALPTRVRLTVRRVRADDLKLPAWFRAPRAEGLKVKRLPPPGTEAKQAAAYGRWVGIQLCSPDGQPQGHAWRIALFLACIAYLTPWQT